MKNFKATVRIVSIVGEEERDIEVMARTEAAARKKVNQMMGNRDFSILLVKESK